jgi:hypothetical protein
MWGRERKPVDFVPGFEDAQRSRSFRHLTELAGSVVQNLLGPSPQDAEYAAAMDQYRTDVAHWEERERYLADLVERGELRAEYLNPYPQEPKSGLPDDPKSLDRWMRRAITERLLGKLDQIMLDLVGIESSYGGYRLKSGNGTALGTRLADKAKAIAVEVADKWVADHGSAPIKELEREDMVRHFKYELESATKKAIEARIATIAQQRAAHIRTEVLEAAVDRAMFEAYPILRRMDAAERLGAKTETEAAE